MEDFEFFYLLVGMAQILDRITEKRAEDFQLERLKAAQRDRPGHREGEAPPAEPEAAPA